MPKLRKSYLPNLASSVSSIAIIMSFACNVTVASAETEVPAESADELEEVIVTGSRIGKPLFDAPAPVSVFGMDLLKENTGSLSIGDELADLPQFASTGTQTASVGSGASAGTGLNLLNLRGLGSNRTLVLVNGRRHVGADPGAVQPDTNSISGALLERVEVLTGGASSVYGADAVAGVVNFVLKDDFEGLEGTVRGGISGDGDGETYSAELTYGTNFADDRGNIAASFEYSKGTVIRALDRPFAAQQNFLVPDFSADAPFDRRLIEDLRLLFLSDGGTIVDLNGFFNEFFRFAPDGTLNPADLGTGRNGPEPISGGGDGFNSVRDTSLVPSFERISLNVVSHYDISENSTLFLEAKAVGTSSFSDGQPSSNSFGTALNMSIDNPFLSDQARAQILAFDPSRTGFQLMRANRDFGLSRSDIDRQTYRAVAGIKGDLSDVFEYEFSYTYGRTDVKTVGVNTVINPRVFLAADAVVDAGGVLGTPGAIVCGSTLAAAGASGNPDIDNCVAGNFFGAGAITDDVRDYLTVDTVGESDLQQHVVGGFVSGDTRDFLELPGGPIAVVVGGEYRSESVDFRPDPINLIPGRTSGTTEALNGSYNVVEGYAEMVAPLVSGVPGVELLEFSASGRIASYNLEGVGTNTSWGVGAVYSPVEGVRIRSSYQRAVRSPNVAELFSPVIATTFGVFDPCSSANLDAGTEFRRANCAALGIPEDFNATTIGGRVDGTAGGNPNLDVERGETFTIGVVIEPVAWPGFTLAVDYYDIKITDAIGGASAGGLVNLCVDVESIDNPFCRLVTRDPNTFDITFIEQGATNINALSARGIDAEVNYTFPLGSGMMALRAVASWVLERNDFDNPFDPTVPTSRRLYSLGNPKTSANFTASYAVDKLTVTTNVRYFSNQIGIGLVRPEDVFSIDGNPPLNPDVADPDLLFTGDTFIVDLSGRYQVNDNVTVFAGVDNLFEPELPILLRGTGTSANFDVVGRYFYGGVSFSF